jgi:glucokinase-like ROK family protein
MKRAASSSLLREINRSAVLDLFRLNKAISRTQIARKLNMSVPTAMRIVEELIAMNMVHDIGFGKETRVGRPRSLLEFNGSSFAVIGIDLGGTKMLGGIANLTGQVQKEICLPSYPNRPEENLNQVIDLIKQLLASPRPEGQEVLGVGIGTPGITLAAEGVVTWAPSLGWRDFPLAKLLKERFHIPIFIENDVNLAALGELNFGAGIGVKNLVCIAVGTGIGSGVIIGGLLYRGANQAAGEIGYMAPGVDYLNRRYEGFGALESLASGTGIRERACAYFQHNGNEQCVSDLSAEDVFQAARMGEEWAKQIVDDTLNYLALAITNIACLLNPDMIILGGGVSRSADMLIEPILKRIEGVIPYVPRVVASPLDNRAALLGAITLVLNDILDYSVVNPHS